MRPLAERVKGLAHAVGFDLVGIAPALPSDRTRLLETWIARGYAGGLGYVVARARERMDPRRVLPEARSLVMVALAYARGAEAAPPGPRIARYAQGEDYHALMLDRLRGLAAGVEALAREAGGPEPIHSRAYVDTGPVLERVHAAAAGLGWQGKNTLLIHPRLGSQLFLGALLTSLDLPPDEPGVDQCGSCRACLEACPTAAFPEPYVLDATRCIAYATIEDPGPVPASLREGQGDWLFGCDVCQEVCPFNRPARGGAPSQALPDPLGLRERLAPREAWRAPALSWVLGLDEPAWRRATRHSALRRARFRSLLRNALVVAGNTGEPALRPLLERHANGPDPLLAEHARWALARLDARAGEEGSGPR